MDFNKEQLEAINHTDGACIVIAGAGSGKTTVVLNRIKTLIHNNNVKPSDILVISFTAKSAGELENKLTKNFLGGVNVGTFHAVCRDILKKEGYNNINRQPNQYEVKRNCFENVIKGKENINLKDIMSFIGFQKNSMVKPNGNFVEKESKYSENELRKCYENYERYKTDNDVYDFDDQLLLCLDVVRNNPKKYCWKYVLVDECQDNNAIQNELIREWVREDNIMVVGDFRQSIYGFRGARPELFMNFYKYYPSTNIINLITNYRSSNNIVDYSNRFIRGYFSNYEYYKDAKANKKQDGSITSDVFNDRKEESIKIADMVEDLLKNKVSIGEIAILYRNNAHADNIEYELGNRNIPYDISNNGSFFERKEVKGILSILRLILNSSDDEAFENVFTKLRCHPINFFKNSLVSDLKVISGRNNQCLFEAFSDYRFDRSYQNNNKNSFIDSIHRLKLQNEKGLSIDNLIDNIRKVFKINEYIESEYPTEEARNDRFESIENIKKFIKGNNLQSFIDYAMQTNKRKHNKSAIQLMTIHGSKGLEFDNVFLIGAEDGKFPSSKSDINEEARLMYVACTRPRNFLHISSIQKNEFVEQYLSH